MPTRQTTTLPTIQHTVGDGNWDSSRGPIQSIVLHTIVGSIAGADAEFKKPGTQRSVHYAVGLDGSLHQWVDEDNVAYQAGNYPVNQTSIGIEHEDGGNYNDVRPDVLYKTSAKLVADICRFYDFPADHEHIFRHGDVIDKKYFPGGTSCPDALDTDRIIRMAQEILSPSQTTSTQPTEQVQQSQPENVSIPIVEPQSTTVETVSQQTTSPEATDQTTSNTSPEEVQNKPDQTQTEPQEADPAISTPSKMVTDEVNQPLWSLKQSIYELLQLIIKLLIRMHILEEVKD